jgi:hypothetical protein
MLLFALESPVLVVVESVFTVVDSEPMLLFALESPVLVVVESVVVAVELAIIDACCAFKLFSCEASWELSC